MKLVVSTPEPMWRMRVLTAKDQAAETLRALQQVGVLHPEAAGGLEPVDRARLEKSRGAVISLLKDLEDVLAYMPQGEVLRLAGDAEVFLLRPLEELAAELGPLCRKLASMHRRLERLEEEQARLDELRSVALGLAEQPGLLALDLEFTGQALFARIAVLLHDEFEAIRERLEALAYRLEELALGEPALGDSPQVMTPHGTIRHGTAPGTAQAGGKVALFIVAGTRNRSALETLVRRHGRFIEAPGGDRSMTELATHLAGEIERLGRDQETLRSEIEARTRSELETLVLLREGLRAEQARLDLLALACESEHVTLIEGWAPASAVDEASAGLREAVGPVHIDAAPAGPGDEPPSRLRNPALLRPFEVVIGLFATPRYGEWDPTPIVAYFFALFFGVMLGDAVYGLSLLALTHFLLPRFVADPEAEGFIKFRRMLSICAVAAIVMGVLQGSYLGDFAERFLGVPAPALSAALQHLYLEPMAFIVVSLAIGLVHVNLGHLLMLLRGLRERKAYAVVGQLALFLLQLAALPWILRLLGVDWLPLGEAAYQALLGLLLLAVVLVIVASLMERGLFLGSILWVFDISGILGDVMSYARLAGVGLATYFLAYSFNMLAVLVAGMLPATVAGVALSGVLVLFILVFGHLLNFVLSSITCFVHALRLCFVEFLFKFSEGGGRPYAPFRLRRRSVLPARGDAGAGAGAR